MVYDQYFLYKLSKSLELHRKNIVLFFITVFCLCVCLFVFVFCFCFVFTIQFFTLHYIKNNSFKKFIIGIELYKKNSLKPFRLYFVILNFLNPFFIGNMSIDEK